MKNDKLYVSRNVTFLKREKRFDVQKSKEDLGYAFLFDLLPKYNAKVVDYDTSENVGDNASNDIDDNLEPIHESNVDKEPTWELQCYSRCDSGDHPCAFDKYN